MAGPRGRRTVFTNGKLYRARVTPQGPVTEVIAPYPYLRAWAVDRLHGGWRATWPALPAPDLAALRARPRQRARAAAEAAQQRFAFMASLGGGASVDTHYGRRAVLRWWRPVPLPIAEFLHGLRERRYHVLGLLSRCGRPAADLLDHPALLCALSWPWEFVEGLAPRRSKQAARRWMRWPRARIAGRLGFPATRSVVRLLRRIPVTSITPALLQSVRDLLCDEGSRNLLAHHARPHLNAGVVALLERSELRSWLHPSLIECVAGCNYEEEGRRAAAVFRECLALARDLGTSPPRARSLRELDELHAEFRERVQRHRLGSARFPPPPFVGLDGIEPLRDAPQLVLEGQRMSHCCASWADTIRAGRAYVYRVTEPERCTLGLVRQHDRWDIGELRGKANRYVSATTRERISRWLRESWRQRRLPPVVPRTPAGPALPRVRAGEDRAARSEAFARARRYLRERYGEADPDPLVAVDGVR